MSKMNLIIIGASGHGKVVAEIASKLERYSNILFFDDFTFMEKFHGYKMIESLDFHSELYKNTEYFVAIGNNEIRAKKIDELKSIKCQIATLIDPTAIISKTALIEKGSVVMPGAKVNANVTIGFGVIINTGASVDHDSKIDNYCHVSPGAVISGSVQLGKFVWIGANATVVNNVSITKNTLIGAGATVISDVTLSGTYVGVPIRKIKEKK